MNKLEALKQTRQLINKIIDATIIESRKEEITLIKDFINNLRNKTIEMLYDNKVIAVYTSIKEANENTGYSRSTIERCLKGHITNEGITFKCKL